MKDIDGIGVIKKAKSVDPAPTVVLISAFATAETAVEAMREGAYDYIPKPFKVREFKKIVKEALKSRKQAESGEENLLKSRYHFDCLIGESPQIKKVYDLINRVAQTKTNILISGDQILPTISPNISIWPTEPQANPLQDFFESIDRLEELVPEDVLVLPAHGKPFRGAHARLEALRTEHLERLEILLDKGREPRRAVDTFGDLFGRAINDNNRIMATGEALSHLYYLVATGDMTAETDRDGVTWFRAA